MTNKVALITGGVRGIGRSVAQSLAEDGWSPAVCYRASEKEAVETRQTLEKLTNHCMVVKCDVSDPATAEAFVKQVEEEWGRVDALINCAGPYHRVGLLEETVEGWNFMFNHNLHPVFYLSRVVAPGMIKRGWGRIVNFSMAKADQLVAQPQLTAHYIAKVGVIALTRSLARLLAPHGITVNAISPGFINSGSAPDEELEKMVKQIPAGYIGSTQDAVGAVKFLLSEEARYVNGANIYLSGGWGL